MTLRDQRIQTKEHEHETPLRKQGIVVALAGALALAPRDPAYGRPCTRRRPASTTRFPSKILTPDTVETRIGTLKFVDGVPTDETDAEGLRPPRLPAWRGGVPQLHPGRLDRSDCGWAASNCGATKSNQAVIFDQLLDSNPLFLTGNTDTVYCFASLDLETDGPTVVEIPPGCGPGTVNDAFFRFVDRHGHPRPRPGQGRQVPDRPAPLQGRVPKDKGRRRVLRRALAVVRELADPARLPRGRQAGRGVEDVPRGLKIYPLSKAGNPPAMEFINGRRCRSTRSTPTTSSSTRSWIT